MDLPGFIIFKIVLVALAMGYAVREMIVMRRDLRKIREEREGRGGD